MNKSLKCANYKSVLRVQHPAPQDWVWISHDDGDDDDYGDDVLLNGVKDDNAGIGRKAIAALDSAKVIITHRKH